MQTRSMRQLHTNHTPTSSIPNLFQPTLFHTNLFQPNLFHTHPLPFPISSTPDRANGMTTPRFPAAADAFAGGEGRREGRRGALIFSESSRGGLPLEVPLPSHISFLWAESNEAMVRLLSPLIPVAKALGLFLLDFDVYTERRDAEPTARLVVPAVRRFFHTWR